MVVVQNTQNKEYKKHSEITSKTRVTPQHRPPQQKQAYF